MLRPRDSRRILPLALLGLVGCSGGRDIGAPPQVVVLCGNGALDPGEPCDGANLAGVTCESLGFGPGTLTCASTCDRFDRTACGAPVTCGNGALDANEACDGAELGGATCESLGLGAGTLACAANCADLDRSGCGAPMTCGNGRVDTGEVCDGANLGGQTCVGLGFDSGTLACASTCTGFDTTSCVGCEATTCAAAGAECGSIPDGCGGTLACGGCSGDLTCGGGGTANVCGATCEAGCPPGYTCDAMGVCRGGDPSNLVLNVSATDVSGVVTVDGVPFAPLANCVNYVDDAGTVTFTNLGTSASATIRLSCETTAYAVRLGAGTYEVATRGAGSDIPTLRHVVDAAFVVSGASATLNIDVPAADLTGSVTVDQRAPIPEPNCVNYVDDLGTLEFVNTTSRDATTLRLPCTAPFVFAVRLPPATYEVWLRGAGSDIPRLRHLVDGAFVVTGDASNLVFDTQVVRLAGTVTVNGAAPVPEPNCVNYVDDLGVVEIVSTTSNEATSVRLDCAAPALDLLLPPDTYRIAGRGAGSNIPTLRQVVDAAFALTTDRTNVVFDFRAIDLNGVVTVAGNAPAPEPNCVNYVDDLGVLSFANTTSGDSTSLRLGCEVATYALRLPPGTYDVELRGAGSNIPTIQHRVATGLALMTSRTQNFDTRPAVLSGSVTVNGVAPVPEPNCVNYVDDLGVIEVQDVVTGNGASQRLSCETPTFSLPLVAGTYRVWIRGAGSNIPTLGFDVETQLALTANRNVVYDVPAIDLAGRVTVNQQTPVPEPNCVNYVDDLGTAVFTQLASGRSVTVRLACDLTPFGFVLPPGIYGVTLRGAGSNLPPITSVSVQRLAVP